VWAASDSYRVDAGVLRIRTNTLEAARAVRAVLGDILLDEEPAGGFAYSVRLEPPVRGTQPLHVLYEDCRVVRRSRDPRRILSLLVAHVRGRNELGAPGPMRVAGAAVVGARGVALLPTDLETDLTAIERRLNAAGLQNVDMPFLLFDPVSAELVVPPVPDIEDGVLDGLDLYRGVEPGPAAPGRHRVNGWLMDGLRGAGDLAAATFPLVLNGAALGEARVRQTITRIQDTALVVPTWHPWPTDLVSAIVRLAEGRR
jgi:hypothetical protein